MMLVVNISSKMKYFTMLLLGFVALQGTIGGPLEGSIQFLDYFNTV